MKLHLAALLTLAVFTASAFANAPSLMSYQGRVSDASGTLIGAANPVNRTVTFKFYATSTGGTPLYAEAQTVTISAGEFSVLLGNGTGVDGLPGPSAPALVPYINLPSIMTDTVYLGITVDDGTGTPNPEIAPRQQIVSAAFAFRAQVAETVLDGAVSTPMLADSSITTDKIGGGAITTAKLADNSVTTAQIVDGTIITADLANNAVTTAIIANNAVTSAKIADGTIVAADLATAAVTNIKIADAAIDYNKLAAAVQQSLTPVGTILAFAGDTPPPGWLLCNGQTISRSTYSALYSVVGNRFGYGNNSSTFHVPDFRGRFLRGRAAGSPQDPDRNSRTALNIGGATGDAVGSFQADEFRRHTHDYEDIYHSENHGVVAVPDNRGSGKTDSDNTGWQIRRTSYSTGGNETRPTNVYVNYIIKY